MKIAMIVRKLNIKGGTQRQALSFARELKKRGHEITLYTFAYSKEGCYAELLEGFKVVVAPERTAAKKGSDYYTDFRFLGSQGAALVAEDRDARRLAAMIDPATELLNPHDQVAYKVAYWYKRRVKDIPSVWNMNDLPIYRFGYDKMRAVDENFKKPFIRQLLYRFADLLEARYIRAQERIAVVDFFNRGLVKKYLNLPATTVRNGPDLDHFAYKKREAPAPPKIKLLTSGIFLPHRRFEDVVVAVRLLVDVGLDPTLSIIGDYGNDKKYHAQVVQAIKDNRVEDRVRLLGRVSEDDLIQNYNEHDLYLFPHHWQSDGLSPFEAAATGLPILISRTAGSHELLKNGETGMVIEAKNPADIAAKVRRIIEDPALYTRLSEGGNAFVRANLSWQKYTDQMLAVFTEVL